MRDRDKALTPLEALEKIKNAPHRSYQFTVVGYIYKDEFDIIEQALTQEVSNEEVEEALLLLENNLGYMRGLLNGQSIADESFNYDNTLNHLNTIRNYINNVPKEVDNKKIEKLLHNIDAELDDIFHETKSNEYSEECIVDKQIGNIRNELELISDCISNVPNQSAKDLINDLTELPDGIYETFGSVKALEWLNDNINVLRKLKDLEKGE